MEEARKQFIEQQKNKNVERQRKSSTYILVEPTVEGAQCVTVREKCVDEMVQFQAAPITNTIPKVDQQKEYQKGNLDELTP